MARSSACRWGWVLVSTTKSRLEDADSDIPLLMQAKAEHAKLH